MLCKIGQYAVGTCPFDCYQRFERNPVFVQPAILKRCHMHCVLTAHLIDKGRDRQLELYPADDIEYGIPGLIITMSAPSARSRQLHEVLRRAGDVHLIAVLAAGAQISARAYGIAKRSVIG